MRIRTLHPGVTLDAVTEATGFPLVVPDPIPTTRAATYEELALLREVLDPAGQREREIAG